MHVLIKNKTSFTTIDITGVKNIALANGTYSITKSDDTVVTYSATTYYLSVLIQ